MRAAQGMTGKKVKCPHCLEIVVVPADLPSEKVDSQPGDRTSAPTIPPDAESCTDASMRAGASVAPRAASNRMNPELYSFLAPPQSPDELGWLGPYRIVEVLGAGGMGIVFRAEDPELHRFVALKAMLPTMAASASGRERFLREARAAAGIKHDHIVSVYQVGEDRGVPFLAMEFLEGEPLDKRLKREGNLPIAEVLRIGQETALALAAAHQRGLIHRDIKPANIWLETTDAASSYGKKRGGRVKILDFGLARMDKEKAITHSGVIVGTPEYMAPEQAQSKKLDGRTDLFSLGCVLYRMATGRLPFAGTDMISTIMAIATEKPPSPCDVEPAIPPALSKLILQLLAKNPGKRPRSAEQVAEKLERIDRLEKIRPSTGAARRRRLPPLWMLGAAGGLAALIIAGIVIFWPTSRGMVKIESNDPDVQVVFDKDGATVKGADKDQIKLGSGEHGVLVKRGDFEFETDKLVIKKGQTIALTVEFLPGKVQVTADGKALGQSKLPVVAEETTRKREPPPTRQADADRQAAERMLSIGGNISIVLNGKRWDIEQGGVLPDQPFKLIAVNLYNNQKVRDADLVCLEDCKSLKLLNLQLTEVTDAGLVHVKNCLELNSLSLHGNLVTDAGLANFKDCASLWELDLHMMPAVTDRGLAYFKTCNSLRSLKLYGTPVSDVGVAYFTNCKKLRELQLGGTFVSDAGLARFKDCANLRELLLGGAHIGDAGVVPFKNCQELTTLDLNTTRVTDAGLA
jgi:hypothetical protein